MTPSFNSEAAAQDVEEIREIASRPRAMFVPDYHTFDPDHGTPAAGASGPPSPLQRDLRRLRDLATPDVLEFLSTEVADAFLSFLSRLIIHDIPSVGRLVEPVALRAGFLLEAHVLAVSCLKVLLRTKLGRFEEASFRVGLVGMWASPDSNERQRVSAVISALCLALPGTDELLLPIVRSRLSRVSMILQKITFIRCAFSADTDHVCPLFDPHDRPALKR
jgi:hypothetical protein